MNYIIGVVGESGSGKSTSIRNLNSEETFIIAVVPKPLPFRGFKRKYIPFKSENGEITGNYYLTDSHEKIERILKIIDVKMPHIKNIVIDDAIYTMSFEFLDRATEKGFDKFNELAQHFLSIIRTAQQLKRNLKTFILLHSENIGDEINPTIGIKTHGKLIKEKITLEGLFTYLLFTKVDAGLEPGETKYLFVTNNDGERLAKTPDGMFEELYIPNDLQLVVEALDKYENDEDYYTN